jgi:uncharacterized protein YjbI with pentapeptide repeats
MSALPSAMDEEGCLLPLKIGPLIDRACHILNSPAQTGTQPDYLRFETELREVSIALQAVAATVSEAVISQSFGSKQLIDFTDARYASMFQLIEAAANYCDQSSPLSLLIIKIIGNGQHWLAKLRLSSRNFGSARETSAQLAKLRLSSRNFGSARETLAQLAKLRLRSRNFGSRNFGSARETSAQRAKLLLSLRNFGSARETSAQLAKLRLSSRNFGSAHETSAQLTKLRLSSRNFGSVRETLAQLAKLRLSSRNFGSTHETLAQLAKLRLSSRNFGSARETLAVRKVRSSTLCREHTGS